MGAPFPRKRVTTSSKTHSEADRFPNDIESHGFDPAELALLFALRLLASSYAKAESHLWERAFDHMNKHFGKSTGPLISYALLNVLRGVQQSPKTVFTFNNPFCPCCQKKITSSEKHLMLTVQKLRQRERLAAQTEAMILCEGFSTIAFLDAVQELVALMPPPQGRARANRMRFF